MSVTHNTVLTAPHRARALPTCPTALLEAAHQADQERRIRAVQEFTRYRLDADGVLVKRDGSGSYHPLHFATRTGCATPYHRGCTCPDHKKHVMSLLDALQAASIGTSVRCKHSYMRDLSMGLPLRIGNRVFRARSQFVAAPVATVPVMAA